MGAVIEDITGCCKNWHGARFGVRVRLLAEFESLVGRFNVQIGLRHPTQRAIAMFQTSAGEVLKSCWQVGV